MTSKPWISGPKELLDHAAEHLQAGNPFDCRVAMISIDNAVELAIRTFLGLPKRVRGSVGPTKQELEGVIGFPELLNLLEQYGENQLSGVELGDIEWYHRLRNALYHEGNGITVDPEMVDAYYQIARLLFQNLFDTSTEPAAELSASTLLGDFIIRWATLETRMRNLAEKHLPKYDRDFRSPVSYYDGLITKGVISPTKNRAKLEELAHIRNSVVHATTVPDSGELRQYIEALDELIGQLPTD